MQWLINQWNEISGNVKYAILAAIGGLILAVVKMLVSGLQLWQQIVLLFLFLVLFGWGLFMTWEFFKIRAPAVFATSTSTQPTPLAESAQVFLGTSKVQMVFPGDSESPKQIPNTNVNIYCWNAFRYSALLQSTDDSESKVGGVIWSIYVVFERPIDVTSTNFSATTSVNPKREVELRALSPRSAILVINGDMPPGLLELSFETVQRIRPPSPTPNTEASPH